MDALNITAINFSVNITDVYPDPFTNVYIFATFLLLYGCVFLCCTLGNILVIFVIIKHRKMRTVTNFFLANLSLADLLVGIFCVIPNLLTYLSPYWQLGLTLCKLHYYVQTMTYTASVMILTVISIERYFAIIHPMRNKLKTVCMLRIIIFAIWTLSGLYSLPVFLFHTTISLPAFGNNSLETTICTLANAEAFSIKAYSIANFVVWYCLPLLIMLVLYVRVGTVLWRSGAQTITVHFNKQKSTIKTIKAFENNVQYVEVSQVDGTENSVEDVEAVEIELEEITSSGDVKTANGEHQVQLQCVRHRNATQSAGLEPSEKEPQSVRRKVIRLLVAVVISFAVCVLPYHLRILWFNLFISENEKLTLWKTMMAPLSFVLFYMNSALNPVLYAFMSENFRRSLWEAVSFKKRKFQTSFIGQSTHQQSTRLQYIH